MPALVIFLLLLLTGIGSAQETGPVATPSPAGQALTLRESVETALKQNPLIKVAQESVEQARAQYELQETAFNPTFKFQDTTNIQPPRSISTSPLLIEAGPSNFPTTLNLLDAVNSSISITLSKLLTTFGNLENQVVAAFIQIDVETQSLLTTERDLSFEVKTRFFNRLKSDAALQVALLNLASSQQSLGDATALFRQGLLARYDVVQAELQVTESQEQVAQAKTDIGVTQAQFRTILNEPDDFQFHLVSPHAIVADPDTDLATLKKVALETRPEVTRATRSLDSAKALLQAAYDQSSPIITFNTDYQTALGNSLTAVDMARLNFQFSWALYDGGLRDAQIQGAEAQVRSLEASINQLRERVKLEVETTWRNFLLTNYTLETARKRVQTAQVYYDMARERYINGLNTSLETQDALRQLNAARQGEVNAIFDRDIAFARLERALGLELKDRTLVVGQSSPSPAPSASPPPAASPSASPPSAPPPEPTP